MQYKVSYSHFQHRFSKSNKRKRTLKDEEKKALRSLVKRKEKILEKLFEESSSNQLKDFRHCNKLKVTR